VLDRLAGPERPKLVWVDPRDTEVAREADVLLAVRPGTNLALMHALVHEVLSNGWENADYIRAHTLGFDDLRAAAEPWTPEAAAETLARPNRPLPDPSAKSQTVTAPNPTFMSCATPWLSSANDTENS
jgi:predicted molibdopterin-dependent oxidoreductase YjgC